MSVARERLLPLSIDSQLVGAVLESVNKNLVLCELSVRCAGIATTAALLPGGMTGLIGIHGKVSGFISVAMRPSLALRAVEGLLSQRVGEMNRQVVTGVGEITNLIAAGIRAALSNTAWAFQEMTVPTTISGGEYELAHAPGMTVVQIAFEEIDDDALRAVDRMLYVSLAMLRL